MNIRKPLVIAGVAAVLGVAGVSGLGIASAASNSPQDGLIDKIATKFNLNKDEVAQVFEADRSEREAERQRRLEARLTQAVADGKITEVQKQKILAKRAELKAEMETLRNDMEGKTDEERLALKEKRAQDSQDLRRWSQDNNIPLQYLNLVRGVGYGPNGLTSEMEAR